MIGVGQTRIRCDAYLPEGGALIGTAYCTVNVLYFPTLNDAANAENGHLEFTNATPNYPWSVAIMNGRAVAKSGGAGVANVTSTMRLVVNMQAGETLSFEWMASCEGSNSNPYDNGKFYVNNTQFGSTITGTTNWATVTYTAPSTATYTFEWRYTKDYSVNNGDDCIYVDNVRWSGDPLAPMGDMDGDGELSISDALDLLRIVLGVVNATPAQAALCDVNGDGTIDLTDVLILLRMAMGVID